MSKADLNNLGQLKTKEFITTNMNSFGIEYLQSSGSNGKPFANCDTSLQKKRFQQVR